MPLEVRGCADFSERRPRMAGFQTHISVSTAVGVGYGWWVHSQFGLPWTTAAVAGGLCSLAGMLPDLDSDNGVPARETMTFTAAIVPMLLMHRFQRYGMSIEQMILAGVPIYFLIRFGVGALLKQFTVHRGMFHSIPAMGLAGMLTFLISDSGTVTIRALKGIAVSLGFLSHLVLDEIWSVEVSLTGSRLKSSSGTAVKFFGNNAAANAMCWGLFLFAGFGVLQDEDVLAVHSPSGIQLAAPPSKPMQRGAPEQFMPPQPPVSVGDFEPLPEFLPPRQPPPAITDQGRIIPNKSANQARSYRRGSYER